MSSGNLSNNTIATAAAAGGDGLLLGSDGIEVQLNRIGIGPGGEPLGVGGAGIRVFEADNADLDENTIDNAGGDAIAIEGGTGGLAITNQLGTATGGNDGAGVRIMQDGTDYTIGGDEEFEENDFAGNADGAIVIEDSGSDGNQVLPESSITIAPSALPAKSFSSNSSSPPIV